MTRVVDTDTALLDDVTSAPHTPPPGKVVIYAKTDGKLYAKDSNGTEYDLTASGDASITIDGGNASSTYGGVPVIDGGNA